MEKIVRENAFDEKKKKIETRAQLFERRLALTGVKF